MLVDAHYLNYQYFGVSPRIARDIQSDTESIIQQRVQIETWNYLKARFKRFTPTPHINTVRAATEDDLC